MNTRTLMVQGTTSDAGKSTLVAGLCRWLRRQGVNVAPFKPQNMALNSAVTPEGGEIGRAQALQAQACGLPPHVDMNPVLLKPSSDTTAQVIIQGRVHSNMGASDYHDFKRIAREAVLTSHARLAARHDVIIVEGAGSPAEINLRHNDIANMGFAEAVDCPVLLVADIDRGGVFAHLVGTLALLTESERARTCGFIINRFRGDKKLLDPGLAWLAQETSRPVIGVLPYLHGLQLDAEDALPREAIAPSDHRLRVIVPALPRISNHTDFDPLRHHPQVEFRYIGPGQMIPSADLIILPGSKNTRADLDWLRTQGWESAILRHLRYGGKLLGICGGFQMLGRTLHDPNGFEGPGGSTPGLGVLDMETIFEPEKKLLQRRGRLAVSNTEVTGYEIHLGRSTGPALEHPLVHFDSGESDGARSPDDQVRGTYLHGLFEHPHALTALLQWAGLAAPLRVDYAALREQSLERLADAVETHLDTGWISQLLGR